MVLFVSFSQSQYLAAMKYTGGCTIFFFCAER